MILLDKWLIIFIARKHYKQKRETKLLGRIKIESNKKSFIFYKLVKIKKVKMQMQAIKKNKAYYNLRILQQIRYSKIAIKIKSNSWYWRICKKYKSCCKFVNVGFYLTQVSPYYSSHHKHGNYWCRWEDRRRKGRKERDAND